MKMVATSYVTQEKTSHSLESLGSENKVSVDPLGTQIEVPVPPIVEKPMVVQTTNLGGEIGSADAPLPTEFLPLKKPPPIVATNKPVDPQLPFCPIQTNEDMTSIQQKRIVTVLETVMPGKNGSNLVLNAVAKMVSPLFNFFTYLTPIALTLFKTT